MTARLTTTRPGVATRASVVARASMVAAALAMVVTGCTGSGSGDGDGGSGNVNGGNGGNEDGDGAAGSSHEEASEGALDRYLAALYQDIVPDEAQVLRVQDLIAGCMADAGFEYVPWNSAAGLEAMADLNSQADDGADWGTVEYAEQWGYGFTTDPGGGLPDDDVAASGGTGAGSPDPNAAIVAAMTDAERAAYDEALWGPTVEEPDDPDDYVAPPWQELGCGGFAHHEVYGDRSVEDESVYYDLSAELDRILEATTKDERVLAAVARWSSCMADAGYPGLVELVDAQAVILDQVRPIQSTAYDDLPPDATPEQHRAARDAALARTAQFTAQEIEVAVADATCLEESGYDEASREVNAGLQQEYYDEHEAELEEYAAYLRGRSAGDS